MDKVDFSNNPAALLNSSIYGGVKGGAKKAGKKPELRKGRNVKFQEILEQSAADSPLSLAPLTDTAPSEETVQELLDAVRSAGDDLRQRPVADEILKYKKAVRNFLHYVVQNGYTVEEQNGIPNAQKPGYKGSLWDPAAKQAKAFHIVQVVDRKLDGLAAEILAGQVTQLELLAKLEEITGLLVDLVS
ncbi:MAG: YaaR family protein [Treponema sp.]|jgi:uncharacterized protein YaaR (DUF327 family)|nr:YaaR family protein [Treponema sp.]